MSWSYRENDRVVGMVEDGRYDTRRDVFCTGADKSSPIGIKRDIYERFFVNRKEMCRRL